MALRSTLFADSERLQACLVSDPAHVTPGSKGDHVNRIQIALVILDDLPIDAAEYKSGSYGPSTASAVLSFKKKRKIINHSYQSAEDNIVGKMTIASMDDELVAKQYKPGRSPKTVCGRS